MEKDENLSLPKGDFSMSSKKSFHANLFEILTATVAKIIKEMLPEDVKCANDTRDLILECCVGNLYSFINFSYFFLYIFLLQNLSTWFPLKQTRSVPRKTKKLSLLNIL